MSTEYYMFPPVRYEEFIKNKDLEFIDSPDYLPDFCRVLKGQGSNYIYVYRHPNGGFHLERYGRNDIFQVFPKVIKVYNCRIFDECGLEYPDCG